MSEKCNNCGEPLNDHPGACITYLKAERDALAYKLEQALKDRDASEHMLGIWRDAEAKRREGYRFEVRLNDDGTLDEIVGIGAFHIEQMDTNSWFMDLGGLAFNVHGKRVELVVRDYDSWQDAKTAGEALK